MENGVKWQPAAPQRQSVGKTDQGFGFNANLKSFMLLRNIPTANNGNVVDFQAGRIGNARFVVLLWYY